MMSTRKIVPLMYYVLSFLGFLFWSCSKDSEGTNDVLSSTPKPVSGTWYYYADDKIDTLYINGVKIDSAIVSSRKVPVNLVTSKISIAAVINNSGGFDGALSGVLVTEQGQKYMTNGSWDCSFSGGAGWSNELYTKDETWHPVGSYGTYASGIMYKSDTSNINNPDVSISSNVDTVLSHRLSENNVPAIWTPRTMYIRKVYNDTLGLMNGYLKIGSYGCDYTIWFNGIKLNTGSTDTAELALDSFPVTVVPGENVIAIKANALEQNLVGNGCSFALTLYRPDTILTATRLDTCVEVDSALCDTSLGFWDCPCIKYYTFPAASVRRLYFTSGSLGDTTWLYSMTEFPGWQNKGFVPSKAWYPGNMMAGFSTISKGWGKYVGPSGLNDHIGYKHWHSKSVYFRGEYDVR